MHPLDNPVPQLLNELRGLIQRMGLAEPDHAASVMGLADGVLNVCANPASPLREILQRLGDRWSTLLIVTLATGRYRHGELRRLINVLSRLGGGMPVSQRMLTLRLRALERDGFVARSTGTGKVPMVEYWLTPLGHSLAAQIRSLTHWCQVNGEQIFQAQGAFDALEHPRHTP